MKETSDKNHKNILQTLAKNKNVNKIYDNFFKNLANKDIIEKLKKLDEDYAFFNPTKNSNKSLATYTLCLDIRNSTDLMVNYKNIQDYIGFVEEIIGTSQEIIKNNNGIYDKFTGDGILCHFIEKINEHAYSDCTECSKALHRNFRKIYKQNLKKLKLDFSSTGIGIGVDYGRVYFKISKDQLFAIGESVNYACRLSCAPAYKTYFNIRAYIEIIRKHMYSHHTFTKKEINIREKGKIFIYEF